MSDNLFKNTKTPECLLFLIPDDLNEEEYAPISNLNYMFCKLSVDGKESKFIDFFEGIFNEFLD